MPLYLFKISSVHEWDIYQSLLNGKNGRVTYRAVRVVMPSDDVQGANTLCGA